MGLTPDEAALARTKGFKAYLDYHLNPAAIDDSAVDSFVATTYPQIAMQVVDLYLLDSGTVQRQLQEATVFRAAFSKRQLLERANGEPVVVDGADGRAFADDSDCHSSI